MSKRCRIESLDCLSDDHFQSSRSLRHPVLVSFPRGTHPPADETPQLSLFRELSSEGGEGPRERMQCVVGNREWRGNPSSSNVPADFFVAVHNKKSNTVRLVETDSHFCLRPHISRTQASDERPIPSLSSKSGMQRRRELMAEYGGKRGMDRLRRYERDAITDKNLRDGIQEYIAKSSALLRDQDAKEGIVEEDMTSRSRAPPHNIEATKVEEAYPVSGLMTPDEFNILTEEASTFIEEANKGIEQLENPGWHDLCWTTMKTLVKNTELSNEQRAERVICVMYLHYIVTFMNSSRELTYVKQRNLRNDMGISRDHFMCLLDRFYGSSERLDRSVTIRRSPATDDALLYYAAVLWVTIFGFTDCGQLGELSNALGVTTKLLLQSAARVGCRFRRKKGTTELSEYLISLKVPLKFPLLSKPKSRKRKRGLDAAAIQGPISNAPK